VGLITRYHAIKRVSSHVYNVVPWTLVHNKLESVRDRKMKRERGTYFGNQLRPRCSVLEYRILS